ncbi:MAG: sigma-70 family RNA polymerase sigma factor [Bryobacter sp.]|jgi:RNA polymerase sigma factor (sigma-70 family)|nr:sigma-70 family RNA polymerase sigma factor [Bryobacter sp. CoA8 C33]
MQISSLNTKQLIESCLHQNTQEVWREFIFRFDLSIRSVVRRRLGSRKQAEEVEDVMQLVYTHLLENDCRALKRMMESDPESIPAYLRAAAAHRTLDYIRQRESLSRGEARTIPLSDAPDPFTEPDVERQLIYRQIDEHLEHCGRNDSGRARRVFWLYYRIGLTSRQIADIKILDLGQKGVEAMLKRLADCVRSRLAEGSPTRNSLPRTGGLHESER